MERLVQSVKALCSSLAAVETPEVTAALNQLPACPCRLQPKVLKVGLKHWKLCIFHVSPSCLCFLSVCPQDASVLAVRQNRGMIYHGRTSTWTCSWLQTPQAFSQKTFWNSCYQSDSFLFLLKKIYSWLICEELQTGFVQFQKKWWRSWRQPSWIWWSFTAARLMPTFTRRRRAAAARRRYRRPALSPTCCPSTCTPPTASPSPGLPGTATQEC